jgi:hypothetical protein
MNTFNNQNLGNNNVVTTTISHELNTPLNAIIGFTDLILEEDSINTIKDYADIIKNSSSQLLDKIHRVIDLNSLDNEKSLFLEEVNALDLLDQALSLLSSEFDKKKRLFNISCGPVNSKTPLFIYTDKVKLEKCFYNLLLSTIYLNKQGEIFINFSIHPDNKSVQVVFSREPISNTPPFNANYNNTILSEGLEDGIGINFAICNKLSKMLGGLIKLELANNRTITFELPVRYLINRPMPNELTILIVEDDTENYKQISKLITRQSITIIRTSISGFLSNISDFHNGVEIIIIGGTNIDARIEETIHNNLKKNNDKSFLINMANYESLNDLSIKTDNVYWFRQPTLKVQLEKIIDNHFKNKNKANPFINTNYERTKV